MLSSKVMLFLLLFFYSTIGSFASVHYCDGQITDRSIISLANCEHEASNHCESSCCSSEESEDQYNENCCEIEQIVSWDDFELTTQAVEILYTERSSNQVVKNSAPVEKSMTIHLCCLII